MARWLKYSWAPSVIIPLFAYGGIQWEAVTIALSDTRVPPHIRVHANPEHARTRTCHGCEYGLATFPPTIRAKIQFIMICKLWLWLYQFVEWSPSLTNHCLPTNYYALCPHHHHQHFPKNQDD